MIDIMDASRYLVFLSYHKLQGSLTPLKLQKLLYLAQGWSKNGDSRNQNNAHNDIRPDAPLKKKNRYFNPANQEKCH